MQIFLAVIQIVIILIGGIYQIIKILERFKY